MQKEAGKDGPSRTPGPHRQERLLLVRRQAGARRCELRGLSGQGDGAARAERRRQDDAVLADHAAVRCARPAASRSAAASASEWGAKALGPLGVVFQQPTLDLDLTVKQNLRYFAALRGLKRKEADERMLRALKASRHGGAHRRARALAERRPSAPGRDRPQPAAQPEAAAARRADHRARRPDAPRPSCATCTSSPAPTISACCGRRICSTRCEPDDDLLVINRGKIVARGAGQGRGGRDRRQGSRRRLHGC